MTDREDAESFDATRDMPNTRFVYFTDGGWARLEREDPYGFWIVRWWKGPTPELLRGQFTNPETARRAIVNHLDNHADYYVTESLVKVERAAPVQYKKRFKKLAEPSEAEAA